MELSFTGKIWWLSTRFLYAVGFRPNPLSSFYSYTLEKESQWRTGK